MNSRQLLLGAASFSLTVGLLAACHNNNNASTTPPVTSPIAVSYDTAQVLALAQQTSESSSPFTVNGGGLTINDTSETSAPIAVDGM